MRIIAGEARGRVLRAPSGRGTRPTDSRSRETLFNILGERVPEARVLDLYAGSGAVGLEALSRGASSCVFIEQNASACNAIRANLKTLGWQEQSQVWQTSVKSALHHMSEQEKYCAAFDIVFADPPFREPAEFDDLKRRVDILARLLHNVGESPPADPENSSQTLPRKASGLLIVQHPQRMEFRLHPPFELEKSRRAGGSSLSFFVLNEFVLNKN